METRLVVPLVGLAISFAVPALAQQKETLDAQAVEKADPLAGKYDKAENSNDAAAVAALFTEDAVFTIPEGPIVGREAIEKQYVEWFKGGRHSNHTTTYDPGSFHIAGTADAIALSGGWSQTVEPVNGKPFQMNGHWLAIDTRGSDGWRIWRLAVNITPAPATTTASAKTNAEPASMAQDAMKVIKADQIVWQEHPVFKGVQVVWMTGDPTKAELIVQRSKIPPHYKIPAHTHPYAELVTVMSGTYYNAMGDDMEKGVELKAGSSFILPAGHIHRTWTGDEETIVQVTFIGPSGATFVNPADDPRIKAQQANATSAETK